MVLYSVRGRPPVVLSLLVVSLPLLLLRLLLGRSFAEPVRLAMVNVGYSGPKPKIAGFSFLRFSYWYG